MSADYQTSLFKWMVRHWVVTFLLMGMAFVVFGFLSLNLVQVFVANIRFLTEHGFEAVKDGGLLQLLELIASAYGAIAFYVMFKTCEHALVERLAHYHNEKE
jgi:hypothetical protein